MSYTYDYPRPAVTVDCIILSQSSDTFEVMLIKRDKPPFEGNWALPGGFVDIDETLEEAVKRELSEETGLTGISLFQLYTFGAVDRDPRHRTISIVYYGFVDRRNADPVAGDDARAVRWFNIKDLPPLAFDHNEILHMAEEKVIKKIKDKR
ncbi:MAG: NUDIX hydrolase [Bacteroidetes bacterium]|nr:NUDIX hydrolase [Bacteroidota bacterium]